MSAYVQTLSARVDALPACAVAQAAWFMDIDGVLNVDRAQRHEWGTYAYAEAIAFEGLAWPLCYSAVLMRLLSQLHAKNVVSFRWLTTWQHDAPTKFAPAVGLDIGNWIAGEDLHTSNGWWKLDVIVEHLESDPPELMIWTDDQINQYQSARRVVDFLHPDGALAICTDERKGLTPTEFDLILSAIERRVASA